ISSSGQIASLSLAMTAKKSMSAHLGNIGIVYEEQGDYPKALDYYFKALKMAEELGDKNHIAAFLGNIGAVYL
ncbi:MAG TPA: tetratricopeptide repeat protein, partial [Ignavibacteria bacterium]